MMVGGFTNIDVNEVPVIVLNEAKKILNEK